MVVDGIKESRTHMGSTGSVLLFRKGSDLFGIDQFDGN